MTVRDKTACDENWLRLIDRMSESGGVTEFLKQIEDAEDFEILLRQKYGEWDVDAQQKLNDVLRKNKQRFQDGERFRNATCALAVKLLDIDAVMSRQDRYKADPFLKQMAEISREIAKQIKHGKSDL